MTIADSELLTTRTGVRLHVRPAGAEDEAMLASFFAHVTSEDLRFRFLATVRQVSHDRLAAMIQADDDRTVSLLAFTDEGDLVATAMLAGDAVHDRAEAAIALRGDRKAQGIGWTLLEHLVLRARQLGYALVEAIEDRSNRNAISIEKEMGFETSAVEGEPGLVRLTYRLR